MALEKPNYTQVPNEILAAIPDMKESELKVTLAIVRRVMGFHKTKPEPLSYTALEGLTGMSRHSVIEGVEAAMERGYIRHEGKGKRGTHCFTMNFDRDEEVSTSAKSAPEPVQNLHQSEGNLKKSFKETYSDALPESGKASVRDPQKARPRNAVFDKVAEYAFGIRVGDPVGSGTAARVGKILAELKTSHGGQYPAVSDITQACLAWKYAHRGLDLPRDPAKFDAMIREWEQNRSTPTPDDTIPAVLATTTPQQQALDSMYRTAAQEGRTI